MSETRYWTQLATEQFSPSDLVRQATAAEAAGFDVEQMGASVVCLQNGSGSDPSAR